MTASGESDQPSVGDAAAAAGIGPPGAPGGGGQAPAPSDEEASEPSDDPARWEHYRDYSATLSEVTRKLVLSGIALIWIFSGGTIDRATEVKIEGKLVWPLGLLLLSAAFDLGQYLYLTLVHWIVATQRKRNGIPYTGLVPSWISKSAEAAFFVPKVALATIGWIWLLIRLWQQVL